MCFTKGQRPISVSPLEDTYQNQIAILEFVEFALEKIHQEVKQYDQIYLIPLIIWTLESSYFDLLFFTAVHEDDPVMYL